MNMFVAIINNSYTKVKEENARLAPEFMLSDYLKLNYSRIVDKLTLRKNRILDIQNVIESDELKNCSQITFDQWRSALRVNFVFL
jgi:polycystin 2